MSDYSTSFPSSRKIYEERAAVLTPGNSPTTLRVPMREVTLTGDNEPVRL